MRSVLLEVLICIAIGYTLGNINPSYVFAKSRGYDVRKDGSGNAGNQQYFLYTDHASSPRKTVPPPEASAAYRPAPGHRFQRISAIACSFVRPAARHAA